MNGFSLPSRPQRIDARRISPVDPPRARASGPAPYRVLAIGGALLAGTGVLTHDLALTGALARGIARHVGHGVDVESHIDERGGLEAAARAVRHLDLSRFDAVVLLLEEADHAAGTSDAVRRVGRVAELLRPRLMPTTGMTVVVPPPSRGREALGLRTSLETVSDESAGAVRIVRLADRVLVSNPAERYGIWGETIGATVAEGLLDPILWTDAVEPLDERRRLTALRDLGASDEDWQTEFRRIVAFARQAYGAACASLSLIDDRRTRYVVRHGFDTPEVPRDQSICDLALHTFGGLIVGDARADDRFARYPLVASGAVRFYAGYRFESPEGQPIGTLCVFDPEPRPVLPQDLTLLRDFASSAERRLWELGQRLGRR